MASDLTKLTVNLVPRSVTSLAFAAAASGDTRTDTVNRALQMYALILKEIKKGQRLAFVGPDSGLAGIEADWFKKDRRDVGQP